MGIKNGLSTSLLLLLSVVFSGVLDAKTVSLFSPQKRLKSDSSQLLNGVRYSPNLAAMKRGDELLVSFSGVENFQLKIDKTVAHANGDVTLVSGSSTSDHEMHITVNSAGALGYLRTVDGRFKLMYKDDEFKVLPPSIMSELQVPSNKADYVSSGAKSVGPVSNLVDSAKLKSAQAKTGSGPVILDVMVVSTSRIRSRLGGNLITRINQLISVANQALIQSDTNTTLSLVHTAQTDYTNDSATLDALIDLQAGSGALSNIASLRSQNKADLVILLRDFDSSRHNFCGFAYLLGFNGKIDRQDRDFGFSVVQDGSSGGFFCFDSTLAHEIGHNLGSAHDRGNADAGSGILPFSHGYDVAGRFFTVMSQDFSGREIQRFSNPRISCVGLPCGVDADASNGADNALSIRMVSSGIQRFFLGPNDPNNSSIAPVISLLLDD